MPLDDDDKAKIATMIADALKTSQTDTKKALASEIGAQLKDLGLDGLKDAIGTLTTDVTALKAKPTEPPKPGAKGGTADDPDDIEARLEAAVAKRVGPVEEELRKAKQRAETERQRANNEAIRNQAHEHLSKLGFGDNATRAYKLLIADGLLAFDDDNGRPGFKGQNDLGRDVLLTLEEGIAAWAKTDDGKAVMPPVERAGAGTGSGGRLTGGGNRSTITTGDQLAKVLGL